jgi:hypothetical protein
MAGIKAKFHVQDNKGDLLATGRFQLAQVGNINGL